jgi:carbonic anhydrase
MKAVTLKALLFYFLFCTFISCQNSSNNKHVLPAPENANSSAQFHIIVRDKVLTAIDQKSLSPERVIQNLKEGNQHFISNKLTTMNDTAMIHQAVQGQYPEAFVLSCIDSRVPVEEVFDQGIGDLFVGRIAGNIVNEDMLGSMEYACKISGAKLILILGHESCGAVKAAIENEKLGNITAMLAKIKPALDQTQNFAGVHTLENHEYVEAVAKNNIINTIRVINQQSPVLKEMSDRGEIKIIGAYYELSTGHVIFLTE